jgi:hypothetical protein
VDKSGYIDAALQGSSMVAYFTGQLRPMLENGAVHHILS